VGRLYASPYYNNERVTTHGVRVPHAQPLEFAAAFVMTRQDGGSSQAFARSLRSLHSGALSLVFALFSFRLNPFQHVPLLLCSRSSQGGVAPSPQQASTHTSLP
jgi:hypothetical protein